MIHASNKDSVWLRMIRKLIVQSEKTLMKWAGPAGWLLSVAVMQKNLPIQNIIMEQTQPI